MKIYNTLTRQKEDFIPQTPGVYKIYACGPTVYNFIHIGNARPLCVFDVLRRYLEWRGNRVDFVQNFTDVDDKIIRRANEEGCTSTEIAERYIAEFQTDATGLNVRPATVHPRATENMAEIIDIVSNLIDKGYAYRAENGDVYFRPRRFTEYGKLSHQPIDELESGARISVGELKEDALDFALWKAAKPGEPFWPSPFSDGRPGWHIECSAMVRRYLGETIDLHCGGQDLIFPHHENEIAQSECCNGAPFARYWMHNGYINVDNKKMSKSLGNFFTVRDVAAQFGYMPIRFFLISSSYRSPINYTAEVLEQAKAALERMGNCRKALADAAAQPDTAPNADAPAFEQALEGYRARFIEAMDDDLNTADAISCVFELVRECNILCAGERKAAAVYQKALALFDELTGVLGLAFETEEDTADAEVTALIEARTEARRNKDWKKADEIRDKLREMNIVLEDTPSGVKWHRA